jgi:hypothetical protein
MIDNLVILATCGGIVAVAIRAVLMERRNSAGSGRRARR